MTVVAGAKARSMHEHAPNHKFQMRSRDVLNTAIGDPHTAWAHALRYLVEGQPNPCHFPREQAGNR